MRIAIYHNLLSGGAKRSLFEQVKRLATRHTLDAYTLSCANHEFADHRTFLAGNHVYKFSPLPLFMSPLGRFNQIMRLFDLWRLDSLTQKIAGDIKKLNYDLVFVQPCQFENSPSVLRHPRNCRAIFYCHEPLRVLYEKMPYRPYFANESKRRQIINRFDPLPGIYRRSLQNNDRTNICHADWVLVNSKYTYHNVREIYEVDAKISYHGVDAMLFHPMRLEKQRIVFSVGSLTPLKGFDFLIDAISYLPTYERPPLVIASNFQNPPEREYLRNLAEDKGVVLNLLGNVSDEMLVKLYNQALITVYAPYHEPFGFVSLESMACGTPVVGVRDGGIPETVIHEQTGILVQHNPLEFAKAISQLLENPDRAQKLGDEGRRHVMLNWTWDRAISILDDQLTSLPRKSISH